MCPSISHTILDRKYKYKNRHSFYTEFKDGEYSIDSTATGSSYCRIQLDVTADSKDASYLLQAQQWTLPPGYLKVISTGDKMIWEYIQLAYLEPIEIDDVKIDGFAISCERGFGTLWNNQDGGFHLNNMLYNLGDGKFTILPADAAKKVIELN